MAWYNFWDKGTITGGEEKLNPSQNEIYNIYGGGDIYSREYTTTYTAYYEYLEVVNRAINMIVDDVSEIPLRVGNSLNLDRPVVKGVRVSRVEKILNNEPNPYQDISSFKRNLVIDYLIDGNMFMYFDGVHLYHLPANYVTIEADEVTYVKGYKFQKDIEYSPSEIIHIKENSFNSIYRGTSRLRPARRTMALLENMRLFQDNFFRNGAVPGLVIKTPNMLSEKIKERLIQHWVTKYNPSGGGKRPLILDGGLEVDSLSTVNFREMAFEDSIVENEKSILKLIGIPPVLLDGGNNANIRPNHRLYYLETVLPIVRKMTFAFERYFGYEIKEDVTNIPALQPELSDQGNYYQSLVNGGVLTPNEARDALGLEPVEGGDELRIPANIAGSAANPSEGGRPNEGDN
jgi:HK97 family phage portal protein